MVTKALIAKTRGRYFRDGKSKSEMDRLTSLSRNAIKKWPKRPQGRRRNTSDAMGPEKLTPYLASLTQALEVDPRRAKREGRRAHALDIQLVGAGLAFAPSPLRKAPVRCIRQRRQTPRMGSINAGSAHIVGRVV